MRGSWKKIQHLGLTAAMVAAWAGGLAAQTRPAGPDGFVPVPSDQLGQEVLPATPLVFTAYAIVWVVLVIYVFTLSRRLSSAERDLKDVQAKLQARR